MQVLRLVVTVGVVLFLLGCGSGTAPRPTATPPTATPPTPTAPTATPPTPTPPTATPPTAVEVTIGTPPTSETRFVPPEATVPAGTQVVVTFDNSSTLAHNLTFGSPIDAATEPVVDAGDSDSIEFTAPEAGTYEFICTIHPWMTGTLTVN